MEQKDQQVRTFNFEVTYINKDGETVTCTRIARNEFEAQQLCGAVSNDVVVISLVNLDI